MNRLSTVFLVLASAAFAEPEARKPLTYSFNTWPVLELHTETTRGTALLSTNGSVEAGAGHDAHRFVLDKDDRVIFGYSIEVRKTGPGTCVLRIKPFDQEKIRQESWYLRQKRAGDVPTVAAAREFQQLKPGDEVQVDIFHNPRTGEKVRDVIKIAGEETGPRDAPKPAGEKFSLRAPRIEVNGKIIRDMPDTWMVGGGLSIYMPGRGDYYFGLAPCPHTPCRAAAWVDHNILRFHAGSDLIEVIARANVLQTSDYRTLWTYYDPESRARATGGEADFTCGDDVESLIRYKKPQKD